MSHYFKNRIKGFTLIELLISISIMGVISTMILLNQSKYTESVSLTNLADTVASSISQAQVYGVAVRETSPGSNNFSASFGVTASLLPGGSNQAVISFVDRNIPGNITQVYDGDWSCPTGATSECLNKLELTRGNYIESICLVRTNGNIFCGSSSNDTIKRVDISFLRPSLGAEVKFFNNGGQQFLDNNPQTIGVRLLFMSPSGLVRSVMVYENGQVSVQ